MRQIHRLPCRATLLAVALPSCTGGIEPEPSAAQVAESREAIINGIDVAVDQIGTPALRNAATGGGLCSSTLLSDRWLLTARHCITTNGYSDGTPAQPGQITLTMLDGVSTGAIAIWPHPNAQTDVALVELRDSLLDPNGHPWATPLYLGRSSDLVGREFYCQGWGRNTCDGGSGVLRWADIRVASTEGDGFRMEPTDNRLQYLGDSGSSCFVMLNGHYNILGVQSSGWCGGSPKAIEGASHLVGIDTVRDWIQSTIGNANSFAWFYQHDHFNGESMYYDFSTEANLAPSYSLNDAISSLTVPAGWTVTLYDRVRGDGSPGARAVFTEGRYEHIDYAMNDLTSRITIREPLEVYPAHSYGGAVTKLLPGCYDIGEMGIDNDAIRSLWVTYDLSIELFEDDRFRGASMIYTGSQSSLGDWDGRASSLCVYAKPTDWCGALRAGEAILPNERITSCDNRFYLTMQTDGNLVLYESATGEALWSSGTSDTDGQVAMMQDDGNFVLYSDNHEALWSSGTWDQPGANLAIQNDGNLVVYQGSEALWASNTCCH